MPDAINPAQRSFPIPSLQPSGPMEVQPPIDYLLIRVDRMGDLILTLPVDQIDFFENKKVMWWIPMGLEFILKQGQKNRTSHSIQKTFSLKQFFSLYKWLKKWKPQAAVVFHAPWWIGFLLWFSGVPQRVGRQSQWHSFLFFNHGLRQKRSLATQHELSYNLELLAPLNIKSSFNENLHFAFKTNFRKQDTDSLQAKWGITLQSYVVVHPGMGGSALNWPVEHYGTLIKALIQKNIPVLITGTAADQMYLAPLQTLLQSTQSVFWMIDQLSGPQLILVLAHAKALVAPSTGVLHLGASCGTPTLGIYSPIRVESAVRWGPLGANTITLTPPVPLKDQYPEKVMQAISPQMVLEKLELATNVPKNE